MMIEHNNSSLDSLLFANATAALDAIYGVLPHYDLPAAAGVEEATRELVRRAEEEHHE